MTLSYLKTFKSLGGLKVLKSSKTSLFFIIM